MALKAIDLFLDDFYYSLNQKRNLIKILQERFSTEFKLSTTEKIRLSDRFRRSRHQIEQLMNNEYANDSSLENATRIFKTQSPGYLCTVQEILSFVSNDQDSMRLHQLMSSYLHMFINRMFIANQRKVELVIYDYLLKYYDSKIAREKKQPGNNQLALASL